MTRAFSVLFLGLSMLLSRPAHACGCMLALSTCNEVGASDLVFIGTVASIEPMFLNRWNLASPASLRSLNNAYTIAREQPSAAALARLRDAYLKTFPDIPADEKNQVQAAKTPSDFASLFYSSLGRGMRVRFQVKTLFKHEDNDDDPKEPAANDPKAAAGKDKAAKDDDDDRKKSPGKKEPVKAAVASKDKDRDDDKDSDKGKKEPAKAAVASKDKDNDKDADKGKKDDEDSFEIETPFGECGIDFQEGETYLVYANGDEDSDVLSTSSCRRTRRLSDAGDDLTYLFFYKNRPEESARLDGFATMDTLFRSTLDRTHDPETVKAPAAGVIIELQSDRLVRHAESDDSGKFVFDGLREGDYKVSAFAPGYPLVTKLLTGPEWFHIAPKSCVRQVLLFPKKEGN
jgi:hypothetical protein